MQKIFSKILRSTLIPKRNFFCLNKSYLSYYSNIGNKYFSEENKPKEIIIESEPLNKNESNQTIKYGSNLTR